MSIDANEQRAAQPAGAADSALRFASELAADPPPVRPPDAMTMAVEPSVKKPALLHAGMVLSFGVGAPAVVCAIPVAAGLGKFSRLRDTPLGSWGLPVLGISMLVSGALLLTIGFGIRDRKRWARPLILAFWLLEGALNVIEYLRGGQARLLWVPFLLFSGWYLYRKQNVVGYFALSREA